MGNRQQGQNEVPFDFALDERFFAGVEREAEAGPSTPLKYASLRMTSSVVEIEQNAEAGPSTPLKYASLRMTSSVVEIEQNAEAGPSTPLRYASLGMTSSVVEIEQNAEAGPSTPLKYASLRMTDLWWSEDKAEAGYCVAKESPLMPRFPISLSTQPALPAVL